MNDGVGDSGERPVERVAGVAASQSAVLERLHVIAPAQPVLAGPQCQHSGQWGGAPKPSSTAIMSMSRCTCPVATFSARCPRLEVPGITSTSGA
jgi:hypothetical protein